MTKHNLFKHIRNTDVAFSPSVITEYEDVIVMQGIWFNITGETVYYIDRDTITVKKSDISNWEKYEHPTRDN